MLDCIKIMLRVLIFFILVKIFKFNSNIFNTELIYYWKIIEDNWLWLFLYNHKFKFKVKEIYIIVKKRLNCLKKSLYEQTKLHNKTSNSILS